MAEKRLVSIAMPGLNEEEAIGAGIEQIQKTFARANSDGEIVVCDNGSTENSVANREEYGSINSSLALDTSLRGTVLSPQHTKSTISSHQPFAVIIPARNAARTLAACLEAVFLSSVLPAEVVVVNDGSSDPTAEIASRFPCRILEVCLERGPMPPRLVGARAAEAPILIFVDADVSVKKDTFERILADFENPEIHAVTGLLSREAPVSSFLSHFKNEYMNYIFKRQPSDSRFLYGSVWAIRKECLIFFEPIDALFGGLVSDSELGLRLRRENRRILLDHALEVVHLKEYNLLRLLKNDFQIPFSFAVLLLAYGLENPVTCEKRFSHVSVGQVLATGLAFMAITGMGLILLFRHPIFWIQTMSCLSLFYAHWFNFLEKVLKERGILFTAKSLLFLPLDQAVMFCGMVTGLIYGHRQKFLRHALGVLRHRLHRR